MSPEAAVRPQAHTAKIRHLHALDRSDAPIAGHKAANLGSLERLGLPVPTGAVVLADEPDAGIEAAVAEALEVLGTGVRGPRPLPRPCAVCALGPPTSAWRPTTVHTDLTRPAASQSC